MKDALAHLETTLETYFLKKAPRMPQDIQDIIVNFGPWVLLISIFIAIPAFLALFGIGAAVAPYQYMGAKGFAMTTGGIQFLLTSIISGITLVMEIMALPGLFKKQMRSWRLIYYTVLIGLLPNLIHLRIFGLLISLLMAAIAFYVLFQIRDNYR